MSQRTNARSLDHIDRTAQSSLPLLSLSQARIQSAHPPPLISSIVIE